MPEGGRACEEAPFKGKWPPKAPQSSHVKAKASRGSGRSRPNGGVWRGTGSRATGGLGDTGKTGFHSEAKGELLGDFEHKRDVI